MERGEKREEMWEKEGKIREKEEKKGKRRGKKGRVGKYTLLRNHMKGEQVKSERIP